LDFPSRMSSDKATATTTVATASTSAATASSAAASTTTTAAAAATEKKDKAAPKKQILLGRPGNNVEMGIVGLPNVGKSSMFNLLTKLNVKAENYPFCTIEPNQAKVPVPDERFDFLCSKYEPKSEKPAVLTINDIAGLVKGASEGKGLGNEFLSNINAVDGIFHVVRGFLDEDIEHFEGSVDPVRDLGIISQELRLKDLQAIKAKIDAVEKMVVKGIDKTKKYDLEVLQKLCKWIEDGNDARVGTWDLKEIDVISPLLLLSGKPVVFLINISETNFIEKKSKFFKGIKEWIDKYSPGSPIIPFSVTFEQKLAKMSAGEATTFLAERKCQSMLPKIITTGYHSLDLIHYFTSGEDEVRAWTVRSNTAAPQAGTAIHGDFEKFFVSVEVFSFKDFKEYGSESAVKAAGKLLAKGRDYIVQDGDILYFKIAGKSAKKK
jgi:obg-like ATPase 1